MWLRGWWLRCGVLGNDIARTEHNNTPLEVVLRVVKPYVLPILRDGPIRFTPHGHLMADDRVMIEFTASIAQHGHTILVARPKTRAKRKQANGRRMRIAVLFSGGPAAGGHNVVAGISHFIGKHQLLGVVGGPAGLIKGDVTPLTKTAIARSMNTGGFDLLGTSRTKITPADVPFVRATCNRERIDALVIVGGDDSLTNAAFLAEALMYNVHPDGRGVQVIGVPKTMDGDVRSGSLLPISFGFSTATRTYAQLVGNITREASSSRKYWHIVRLMGRSASHVVLEVALQTKPTVAVIAEEVAHRRMTLHQIVENIARAVVWRAHKGMEYGVVLIPEGLLESIHEIRMLLDDVDALVQRYAELYKMDNDDRLEFIARRLTHAGRALLAQLSLDVQRALTAQRDSHGNIAVSHIETERMLADLVATRVRQLSHNTAFRPITHFFGYEGRSAVPTPFDAVLSYNLGLVAASLVLDGRTGYVASINEFDVGGRVAALPLTGLLTHERRAGKETVVIRKTLVDLSGPAFAHFASRRDDWVRGDCSCSPGPVQYHSTKKRAQSKRDATGIELPLTVAMEQRCKKLHLW